MPKWRRDAIFGDGPRHPLDRNGRARFRFLARQHRASNRLTACDLDVAEVLVSALGDDGRLDLAHATIAERALCHPTTARRALQRLRELGLVQWVRRLVRGSDTGWRAAQTSNAYCLFDAPRLSLPHRILKTRFTSRTACASQQRLAQPIATSAEIAVAREALERRRRTVEAAMHAATAAHRDGPAIPRLT
jgi:hypothetical protein